MARGYGLCIETGDRQMNAWNDDRAATLAEINDLIAELWTSTGYIRAEVRHDLRAAIAYFRNYHLNPERQALEDAMNRRAA
jgi:hypothetical protein